MSKTIPPAKQQSAKTPGNVPQYPPEFYPLVAVWTLEENNGRVARSVNIVESQAALDELHRIFEEEKRLFGSKVHFHFVPKVQRINSPVALRICRIEDHNHPQMRQDAYCCQCGLRTFIIRIVDDE